MSESTKTEPDEPAIPMEDDAEKLKFIHGQIMKDEPEADKIHPPTVKLPQGPKVKPPACYIILLGADRVGKEKLMDRIVVNTFFDGPDPFTGENYRKSWTVDNHTSCLELLATLNERNTENQEACIKKADAILLIYSITDRKSFDEIKTFEATVRKIKKEMWEKMEGAERETRFKGGWKGEIGGFNAFWLVGNKCDYEIGRVVSKIEGEGLAKAMGVGFTECSAKTGQGVWEVVDGIVRVVRHELVEKRKFEEEEEEKIRKVEEHKKNEEEKRMKEREKKVLKQEAREKRLKVWRRVVTLGLLKKKEVAK